MRRSYQAIPGPKEGRTHLTIYDPGEFMPEQTQFMVGIGGSGVGHTPTLDEAKVMLLERAKLYCQSQIAEAVRTRDHYQLQLQRLNTTGLGNEIPGPDTETGAGR